MYLLPKSAADYLASMGSRSSVWFLSGLILIMTYVTEAQAEIPMNRNLRCYQCENEAHNQNCSRAQNLKLCAPGLNVCTTRISHDAAQGTLITKKCAKGPCNLDVVGSIALGFDKPCDRRRSDWECSHCCKTDGCNANSGSKNTATVLIFAVVLVLLVHSTGSVNFFSL